jgi:hypothetical protein
MSVLNKLTEGIVDRDLQKEGAALLNKWEKTGLLEGIDSDTQRNGMARLLENQAKELLREASSMAAGDVQGFSAVAFPLVRRVFGGLIANDLVSVQPMSLPSGLIFFLDFTFEGQQNPGLNQGNLSIYGGGVVGSQLTGGVDLGHDAAHNTDHVLLESQTRAGGGGFYNLGNGYAATTGSVGANTAVVASAIAPSIWTAGLAAPTAISAVDASETLKQQVDFDPDLLAVSDQTDVVIQVDVTVSAANLALMDADNLMAFDLHPDSPQDADVPRAFGAGGDEAGLVIKRLTRWVSRTDKPEGRYNGTDANRIRFTIHGNSNLIAGDVTANSTLTYPATDQIVAGGDTVGAVQGADNWALEEPQGATGNSGSETGKAEIAEIDIKVDSVAVTAQTKKLKAKWSPELGQDLNAYHNLDAEVELTGILSEQIALEIDREILNDLVNGASAGTYYWSRSPGLFVNRVTGAEIGATAAAPDFTGTVSEWYETLVETINDVSAQIHRKTLRGGANFIVVGPEVANILEFTAGFRADVTGDTDRGSVGAVKTGALSKKWDVLVDPYFPRNIVLVGRKGGSFLESGYVYAPYVPLQVTPTIFGTEDFVPRKGVMTRYAKKMVRPDMYGLVIVRGLNGESGASS